MMTASVATNCWTSGLARTPSADIRTCAWCMQTISLPKWRYMRNSVSYGGRTLIDLFPTADTFHYDRLEDNTEDTVNKLTKAWNFIGFNLIGSSR